MNFKSPLIFILLVFCNYSFSGTVTKSNSFASPISIDNIAGYLPALSYVSGVDFPATDLILAVNVTFTFTKTDGTCALQTGGNAYHGEIGMGVINPGGTFVVLANYNTWSGGANIGTVDVTFDQTALNMPSGTPTTGSFQPNNGNLLNYTGSSPFGNWNLYIADNSANDPICLYGYSITIITYDPLPIELLSFNAYFDPIQKSVLLNWETASELNNDYFTIERSEDGFVWNELKKIQGAGTSSEAITYSTIDHQPFFGISYYRLKQTDFDGKFEYFDAKSINHSRSSTEIHVNQQLIIINELVDQLHIYNLNGQLIAQQNNVGPNYQAPDLPTGIYILKMLANNKMQSKKVFIE